jgi:hypothetical protein
LFIAAGQEVEGERSTIYVRIDIEEDLLHNLYQFTRPHAEKFTQYFQ